MPFDYSSIDQRLLVPGHTVALVADPSRTGVTDMVDVPGRYRGPMARVLWHERERKPSFLPLTALKLSNKMNPIGDGSTILVDQRKCRDRTTEIGRSRSPSIAHSCDPSEGPAACWKTAVSEPSAFRRVVL